MKYFRLSLGSFFIFSWLGCATTPKVIHIPSKPVSKSTTKAESKPTTTVAVVPTPTPAPVAVVESTAPLNSFAIFYVAHPEGTPDTILSALKKYPELKLTLIFPPKYFSTVEKKAFLSQFKAYVSSGQVEVAMALENEPILPLLGNLKLAGGNSTSWRVEYAWPDDIAAHVAQGSGRYQKLWGKLPAGFVPPYNALSTDVVSSLKRFRLDWVLGKPVATESAALYDSVVVVSPPTIANSTDWPEGSPEWADQQVSQMVQHSFALVDGRTWTDVKSEAAILDRLGFYFRKSEKKVFPAKEWIEGLLQKNLILETSKIEASDLSPWVQTNKQRVAWTALSDARHTIQNYKNSGQANVSRLDAAFSELYSAQSGPFLLELGQSDVPLSLNEKNFVATLANVYRLSNSILPTSLNTIFTKGKWDKPKTTLIANDRPFFEQAQNATTWNDSSGDDNGGGRYVYPSGSYPKGCFDLSQMRITWTDDDVKINVSVSGNFPAENLSLQPAFDLYVDVNKLVGAGNTLTLPNRGQLEINREAAWEYALTITPKEAALYTATASGDIKKIMTYPTQVAGNNSISFSVPRRFLRGEPDNWRYTLGLFSYDNTYSSKDITPASILTTPTVKNFGGALSSRQSPAYIDLLTASAEDQKEPYGSAERGAKGTLPYVEGQ